MNRDGQVRRAAANPVLPSVPGTASSRTRWAIRAAGRVGMRPGGPAPAAQVRVAFAPRRDCRLN
eukprot:scaffold9776_cov126-Isochrysis_galbana.AAC.4